MKEKVLELLKSENTIAHNNYHKSISLGNKKQIDYWDTRNIFGRKLIEFMNSYVKEEAIDDLWEELIFNFIKKSKESCQELKIGDWVQVVNNRSRFDGLIFQIDEIIESLGTLISGKGKPWFLPANLRKLTPFEVEEHLNPNLQKFTQREEPKLTGSIKDQRAETAAIDDQQFYPEIYQMAANRHCCSVKDLFNTMEGNLTISYKELDYYGQFFDKGWSWWQIQKLLH
jgi:hypothetical protein